MVDERDESDTDNPEQSVARTRVERLKATPETSGVTTPSASLAPTLPMPSEEALLKRCPEITWTGCSDWGLLT